MTALPQLPKPDADLLSAFIICRGDLSAILATTEVPAPDLLAWHRSPAVQEHLAALKSLVADALEIRSAQSRTIALATLESIATTSKDPVEQRRAATGITSLSARPRATTPAADTPQRAGPDPAVATPSAPATGSSPSKPHLTPTPDRDAESVARLLANALHEPANPRTLSTLHAHLTPTATIADHPAPPADFAAVVPQLLKHLSRAPICQTFINPVPDRPHPKDAADVAFRLSLIHNGGTNSSYLLRLARSPAGWFIASLSSPYDATRTPDPVPAGPAP